MGHSFLLLFLTNFIHKMSELDFFSAEPVEEDPAAAFLAREQDELAALEDDGFPSVTQAPAADITNVLGMTENAADVLETTPAPVAPSESPVPSDVYAAISQVDRVRQEPEKIKVWR